MLARHTLEPWPHSHDTVATLSTKSWLSMSRHHLSHEDASPCGSVWQDPPASDSFFIFAAVLTGPQGDAHLAFALLFPALTRPC